MAKTLGEEITGVPLTHTIPGPLAVRREVLEAMAEQQIGHRSIEMNKLYSRLEDGTKRVALIPEEMENWDAQILTASGSGVYDLIALNFIPEGGRVLAIPIGAFGEKFADTLRAYKRMFDGEVITTETMWGEAITGDLVNDLLKEYQPDALAIVHNETSTGVMNPLEEILGVVNDYRKNHELLLAVDAVSSFGGVPIKPTKGIDVLFASSQKALGVPPGLAVVVISPYAQQIAESIDRPKGGYFDYRLIKANGDKNQTPSTPNLPVMYALDKQLDYILGIEGLQNRFDRHAALQRIAHAWVEENREYGLRLVNEEHPSVTVSAIRHPSEWGDGKGDSVKARIVEYVADELRKLSGEEAFVDKGYRKFKEPTFRIAHMGDITPVGLSEVLSMYEEGIRKYAKPSK